MALRKPSFQVEISWLRMRTMFFFPFCVNCSFNSTNTHMQEANSMFRLLFVWSWTNKSLCQQLVGLLLDLFQAVWGGIDRNLFTNQSSTQEIPSVIADTRGSHTLILYHLCNSCKIIPISSKPDAEMMRPETVFHSVDADPTGAVCGWRRAPSHSGRCCHSTRIILFD